MKNRHVNVVLIIIILSGILFILCVSIDVREHRYQWWYENITGNCNTNTIDLKKVRPIKVAIIDTCINMCHKDLQTAKLNKSYVLNGCYESDIKNRIHGTAIAGVIAAEPADCKGLIGIADTENVEIISICAAKNNAADIESLVKCIDIAIAENVDIINMSIGVKRDSTVLHNAIKKAYKNNILIISAIGNDQQCLYPAAYAEVLRIGSMDINGNIKNRIDLPAVYLPGEDIVTTSYGECYNSLSGSSISCGIMAGIMATALAYFKNVKVESIIEVLYSDGFQEHNGKINLNNVLQNLKEVI